MKNLLLMATAAVMISAPAMAKPKPWIFSWCPGHFSELEHRKEIQPNTKDMHLRQWDSKKWNPDVWIQQAGDGETLMEGFYAAGILEDQTYKDEIPYLHVGENFHKLGGYDQRRVLQSVDEVYGITNIETDDLFYVYDDYNNRVIGMYTKHGLQVN